MWEQEKKKIINNAISAYLLLMISWSFLLIKENRLINNDFVKNHSKASTILHISIFIVYVIFIYFWFLDIFSIFSIWLNTIIAAIFFIVILAFMILWIYKASNFEKFDLWETIKIKDKTVLDITKDWDFWEKDKLTLIFSYIPFIGYIFSSKYDKNPEVKSILRFNVFSSSIITIIYLLWYGNLTSLILLIYIIFIAFIWVNLFGKSELINFNLSPLFDAEKQVKYLKYGLKYLKNYLKSDFKHFEDIKKEQEEIEKNLENLEIEKLSKLEDFNLSKIIIYIPIINFISLFQKENKLKFHIRNAIILSLIFIIFSLLVFYNIYSYKIFIVLAFPISFWIWNLYKSYYKMPFIYEIYEFFAFVKNLFIKNKNKFNEKRKEVKEVNLKVK